MGRVNCTENVWLSKVPLVPLRQPFCEKQGFGKSPWLRESVLRKKNRPHHRSPPVGLEPTATRLKVVRSAD